MNSSRHVSNPTRDAEAAHEESIAHRHSTAIASPPSASAQELYHALVQLTRVQTHTQMAIEEACASLSALHVLSQRKPLFSGRWDLAKAAAAVTHSVAASLLPISSSAAAQTDIMPPTYVRAFWQLLTVAVGVCPLACCARLAETMRRINCVATNTAQWLDSEVVLALVEQLQMSPDSDVAVATTTVFSLLSDTHVLAAVVCSGAAAWQSFERFSLSFADTIMRMFSPTATDRALKGLSPAIQNSLASSTTGKASTRHDALKSAESGFCGQWLAVVMLFATRCASELETILTFLANGTSSGHDEDGQISAAAAHCVRCGWGGTACCTHAWARLRSLVFTQACAVLSEHHNDAQRAWSEGAVAERLRTLLVGAPRHLPDNFLEPLGGSQVVTATIVETLHALTGTAAELPPLEVDSMMRPLRLLRDSERWLGATALQATPVATLSVEEYRAVLRPVAVMALREERADVALELLEWAAPLGVDEGWRTRLHRSLCGACEDTDNPPRQGPLATMAPCESGTLFSDYVARFVHTCSATEALDVLMHSVSVMDLRCVCHALLHQVGPWAAPVLVDPYAYNALFVGLGKLVDLLLNDGDAPLARTYLSALCLCLCQRRSSMGLRVYLEVLARFAVVVADAPFYCHRPALTRAYAAWVAIAESLRPLAGPREAPPRGGREVFCTVPRRLYTQCGTAFAARRAAFASLRVTPPSSSPSARTAVDSEGMDNAPVTVVRLHLCQGHTDALLIERHRLNDPLCREQRHTKAFAGEERAPSAPLPSVIRSRVPVAECVRVAIEQMTAIMRDNRLHLAEGCTSTREARRDWWSRRFNLERALRELVASMDAALGAGRALLCGELPAPLRLVAWTLSRSLAASVRKLLTQDAFSDSTESVETLSEWEAELYAVVQALPLLNPPLVAPQHADQPVDGHELAPPRYPLPLSPCCCARSSPDLPRRSHSLERSTPHGEATVGCDACRATAEKAVDALVSCVEQLLTRDGSLHDVEAADSCLKPRLRELCHDTVQHLLGELVQWQQTAEPTCAPSRTMPSSTHDLADRNMSHTDTIERADHASHSARLKHVDVYRIPREHVHIVLEGSLHLLPWECTDALRWFSASRIPSLTYAHTHALTRPAQPLHRLHLAMNEPASQADVTGRGGGQDERCGSHGNSNSNSATSKERFAALVAQHPLWSVSEDNYDVSAHSSTMQSSTNTSASDQAAAPEPPARVSCLTPCSPAQQAAATSRQSVLWQRLVEEDITGYVYVGHKTGEHLISRAQLLDSCPYWCSPTPPRAPSLVCLMGCSSAFMVGGENYEGYGMPWAFLHAGTESLLGCLWDITDRDTDRLTRRFLSFLVGDCTTAQGTASADVNTSTTAPAATPGRERTGNRTLCSVGEALAQARMSCKLPYLSGAAIVLYGVNTVIEHAESKSTP